MKEDILIEREKLERIEQELSELRKGMDMLLHAFKLDGSKSFRELQVEARQILEMKEIKRRKRGDKISRS